MMNNLDPPLEEPRHRFDVLSITDTEQIRSLLDLLTAKLGRLTGNTVTWSEISLSVSNYQLENPNQWIMNSNHTTQISKPVTKSNPKSVSTNYKPIVSNIKTNNIKSSSMMKPSDTPKGIEMNISQPVPRKIQDQQQPLQGIDSSKEDNLSSDELKSISLNPMRKQAHKLESPGVQPERKHLRVPSVIGNNRYYLISKVAILGSNKPLEPVFQSEETGLFYNNLGRCLKTDRDGRILVYKTKKGQYRYGLWAQPKPKSNDIDTLIQESRDELAIHEAQYGYQTILNPDYKSGKVKKPRLLTIGANKQPIKRHDDPLYFQKIEEMAFLCRLRRRNSKVKSKQDSDLVFIEKDDEKQTLDMVGNSDMDISEGDDHFGADSDDDRSRSDFDPEVEYK